MGTPARYVFIAIAAATLLYLSLRVWRYFGRYQPFADLVRDYAAPTLDNISLEVSDATVVGRSNGHTLWRMQARRITLSRDRRHVEILGLHDAKLFDPTGHTLVTLSAGRALYGTDYGDLATGRPGMLALDDGIRATVNRPKGLTLATDRILWDPDLSTLTDSGVVTATLPNGAGSFTGRDITIDTKTGDFSARRLHGTFLIDPAVE